MGRGLRGRKGTNGRRSFSEEGTLELVSPILDLLGAEGGNEGEKRVVEEEDDQLVRQEGDEKAREEVTRRGRRKAGKKRTRYRLFGRKSTRKGRRWDEEVSLCSQKRRCSLGNETGRRRGR